MKRLTLLRHAKSERDSPTGADFDRTLNNRGRADAGRMGQEIRELDLTFDLVLASPAQRVVQTVEGVAGLSPQYDQRIYEASTETLLDIVRSTDGQIGSLLLVGHNPGFERLAARLTDNQVEEMPTAALAVIELPVDHWRDVGKSGGRLVRFLTPKSLN